jgi:uncharacterized membrane protein SirB2
MPTLTTVAAGGLVLAGAALPTIAGNGDDRGGPLLFPTDPEARRNGAPRPIGLPEPERSTMSTRFVSNLLLVLAGVVVIVATQAFAPATVAWIAFAVTGVGVLVLMAATALAPARGHVQRALDGIAAVLAAWTVVESLVFSGTTMVWLTFGAAAGIVAIGVAGLIAHELSTERVVHSLEDVRSADRHMEALA